MVSLPQEGYRGSCQPAACSAGTAREIFQDYFHSARTDADKIQDKTHARRPPGTR